MTKSENFRAYIAATIVVCIWSGWITISRFGVQTSLSPFDITLLRFATASIITLPFSLRYNWSAVNWKQILIIALGCGFPYTIFSFIGLQSIKAANAGVLVNGMLPVFGLLFIHFWFKEKVSALKLSAIVILLFANLLMMNWQSNFNNTYLLGIGLLISASFVFSSYLAGIKKWGYTMKDVIAFVPIVNLLLFLPFWLYFPSKINEAPINDILIQAIYQGLIVSVFALLLVTYAVGKLGSATMSVFLSYVPAVTAILAFVFLGEVLSSFEKIGILMCSIGLIIYAKG